MFGDLDYLAAQHRAERAFREGLVRAIEAAFERARAEKYSEHGRQAEP